MLLSELAKALQNAGIEAEAFGEAEINDITFDSRNVKNGALFTCKGEAFKEEYLLGAIESGASAYMAQKKFQSADIPCIVTGDIRKAMSIVAITFFGEPFKAFNTVGITGTKGKTTTTFFLNNIFNAFTEIKNSAFTTVEVMLSDEIRKSVLTTPEAYDLQRLLYDVKQKGSQFLTMEVSSQALKVDRVYGMHYDVGIFLNVDDDHISPKEHPDWNDYFNSKLKLFELCDTAVVNMDDPHAEAILEHARANSKTVYTYGESQKSDYRITDIVKNGELLDFEIKMPNGDIGNYSISMHGRFNVSNALAAIITAKSFGVSDEAIKKGLLETHVPGRMDFFYNKEKDVYVVVDFAHNKLSFDNLFKSLKDEYPERRFGVVIGSAGGKGFQRRKAIGEVLTKYADYAILTDCDSNYEDTESICRDILQHVGEDGPECRIILDREEAITTALKEAQNGDIIALVARGEESRRWWKGQILECVPDTELARRFRDGEL